MSAEYEIQEANKIASTYQVEFKTPEGEIKQIVAREHRFAEPTEWIIWYYKTGTPVEPELKDAIIAFIHQQERR